MNTERTTINRANKLLAKFIAIANGVALAEGCTLDTTTSKGLTTLRLSQAAPDGSVRVLLHVEATVARLPEKAQRAKPEQKVLDFNAPAAPSAPPPRNSIDDTTPPELPADVAPTLPLWLRDLVLVAPPGAWCIVEDRGREPFDHREFENETDARAHLRDTQLEALDVRRAVLVSPDREPLAWWRFNTDNTFERWPELPMQPAEEPFADVAPPVEAPRVGDHVWAESIDGMIERGEIVRAVDGGFVVRRELDGIECTFDADQFHPSNKDLAPWEARGTARRTDADEKRADESKKPRNRLFSVEVHDRHDDGLRWSAEKGLQFILGGFLYWDAEGGASKPGKLRQVAIVPAACEGEMLEELALLSLGSVSHDTDNSDTLLRVSSRVHVDDGAPWSVVTLDRNTYAVTIERDGQSKTIANPYEIRPRYDGSGEFRLLDSPKPPKAEPEHATPKAEPKTATPKTPKSDTPSKSSKTSKSTKSKPTKKGPRA